MQAIDIMLQSLGVAVFLGSWASLYLLDAFLKSQEPFARHYNAFLEWSGMSVSVCQVRWYTTGFNRLLFRVGQAKSRWLRRWFDCGIVVSLMAMVLSVCVLTVTLLNAVKQRPASQQVLTPVMPGVNLPMSQISYYLLTLLICGILHEVGHAIAAVREHVRVCGFGLFVFAIYPGAYVNLHTEQLLQASPLRQLRIYCAGVWHNVVIVLVAILTLVSLPWLMAGAYQMGGAVVITSVVPNSAVWGPKGLFVGDQVVSVGGCRVTSTADWVTCINVAMQERNTGFCVPMDIIKQQDISSVVSKTVVGTTECCVNSTDTHLCFSYRTRPNHRLRHACLPARPTTDRLPCHHVSDCHSTRTACVVPELDNSTRLLRVMHRRDKPPLLFLGHPLDLHYAVTLSDYVPSYTIVPVNLPYVIETFCKYLISLSGALALLNVVPCYALDGQWIIFALVDLCGTPGTSHGGGRGAIASYILLAGTTLLALNIILAMWTLFVS